MLLANVLLLNLLIALFASTYERVTDRADRLWKSSRLTLVIEYKDKPILPVPFCIFYNALFIIKVLLEKIISLFQSKVEQEKFDWGGNALQAFKILLVKEDNIKLHILERMAAKDVQDDLTKTIEPIEEVKKTTNDIKESLIAKMVTKEEIDGIEQKDRIEVTEIKNTIDDIQKKMVTKDEIDRIEQRDRIEVTEMKNKIDDIHRAYVDIQKSVSKIVEALEK